MSLFWTRQLHNMAKNIMEKKTLAGCRRLRQSMILKMFLNLNRAYQSKNIKHFQKIISISKIFKIDSSHTIVPKMHVQATQELPELASDKKIRAAGRF